MQPFIGQIQAFGFNFTPPGWLVCDGSLQSISQYEVLFTLIGTTYGGNGTTTFALPDLRGRTALHQGQGPGLCNYVIGQPGGAETVTLSISQMPMHTHALTATSNTGGPTGTPGPTVMLGTATPTTTAAYSSAVAAGATPDVMATNSVGMSGNGLAHQNMMPTTYANYCIATVGIFPTQS